MTNHVVFNEFIGVVAHARLSKSLQRNGLENCLILHKLIWN